MKRILKVVEFVFFNLFCTFDIGCPVFMLEGCSRPAGSTGWLVLGSDQGQDVVWKDAFDSYTLCLGTDVVQAMPSNPSTSVVW